MKKVTFSAEERKRLANVCVALGTTFQEFCHFATMQAVDECEGLARDQKLISAYYENHTSESQ
jgi:hypothetical protein